MTTAPDGGPDRRTPDRDRQLVDHAADVRKTRGEVARLRNVAVELAAAVSEWGPQLTDVQRDVAEMRGVVDELATAPEVKNAAVDWVHLPAEDAEREWRLLGEWVHEVLGGWYLLTRAQLPDCWALHRPAFLQVAWLRTSHIEAYLSRSNPAQAAEWNVRWLDAALAKIKEYVPALRCWAKPGERGEHLVDRLEAEQQHSRERRDQPRRYAAADPYPNPYAPAASAAAALTPPARETGVARRGTSSAGEEVVRWDYWGSYFDQAMKADLAWRREREARRAENETDDEANDETGGAVHAG